MKALRILITALACLAPAPVLATALELPAGAVQTARLTESGSQVDVAVAPFMAGSVKMTQAEGVLRTETWRVPASNLSTFQIMKLFRDQLGSAGYKILLDCESNTCGGFDFRYAINLMPEPEMHVDLGDFRYVSARKPNSESGDDFIAVVVSRSADTGYVQLTSVGPTVAEEETLVLSSNSPSTTPVSNPVVSGDIATNLLTLGRAALDDLSFATGSSKLESEEFASLAELADFLKANTDMSIALVGHTDAVGSLSGNLALSKKRAASVLERLARQYDVPRKQMEASGVGYLSPRASNLTDGGRTKNRRVEVILTSTR